MRIDVGKIPTDGLVLKEQLDPKTLSLSLNEQGINFVKLVDAKATIKKAGSEILVNVTLEVPVEYTCSRCLTKIENVFKKEFNVNYEVESGDILEIDEDIRQEVIVSFPMKVVCNPNCKGLCPNCGQNLNIAKCECK